MILVTGATGRVGHSLFEVLLRSHEPVRVLVRNPQKGADYQAMGASVVLGDLDHLDCLESALQGCDRLVSIPPNTLNQAEQEIQLFQAAQRAGISHVIKLSSIKADTDSPCLFFRHHAIAEQYLKQSGIAFTILQSNSFMQNWLWFTHEMRTKGTLSLPMRDAMTAPVDIGDIVRVASVVVTENGHTGKTYNVTGSERYSLSVIALKLSPLVKRKVTYVDIAPLDFRQTLLQVGVAEWFAEAVAASWQVASQGQPTITDVVLQIGKKRPTTLDEFVGEHASVGGM